MKKQIIIEGAGGLQVPINNQYLMSDLAKKINLPLIPCLQNISRHNKS